MHTVLNQKNKVWNINLGSLFNALISLSQKPNSIPYEENPMRKPK